MPRCLSVGAVIAGNSKMVLEAGFLWLEATAWWSWSDSNQPPKCYGTWLVSQSSTCKVSDIIPDWTRGIGWLILASGWVLERRKKSLARRSTASLLIVGVALF